MEIEQILKAVDHTILAQTASYEDIKKICSDGLRYKAASVCIPPYYVKFAKEYTKGEIPICTVIGFPNGYSVTEAKVMETKEAIKDGADEIDMVINICMLKNKEYDKILQEIQKIKEVCGDKILKVIIETCLLTDDEKREMCRIVTDAGAEFIKTSTGFSSSGATFDDIKLFKENVGKSVMIKASGGISSFDDAVKFMELGANRLGTSRLIKLADNKDSGGY